MNDPRKNSRVTAAPFNYTFGPSCGSYSVTVPEGTLLRAIPEMQGMYWVDEFAWLNDQGTVKHDAVHYGIRVPESATRERGDIPAAIKWEAGTRTIRSAPGNNWIASFNSWDGAIAHDATAALIVERYNAAAGALYSPAETAAALAKLVDVLEPRDIYGDDYDAAFAVAKRVARGIPAPRFVVVPQRDFNLSKAAGEGTMIEECPPEDATQWAVFGPVGDYSELVEDYPTREAAEAAVAALHAGEALPDPVWPLSPCQALEAAARTLLASFGGDVPDWLRSSVDGIENALTALEAGK